MRITMLSIPYGFNPRARGGRDQAAEPEADVGDEFQSTRPRRARRPATVRMAWGKGFQSTRPRRARPA